MIRTLSLLFVTLLLWIMSFAAQAQTGGSVINAASCQQSDVNAVINGPRHTALNGDTINIPAGSCTWTSGVIVPSGIGISIIGAGSANTSITDNITTSTPLFSAAPTYGNALMRVSSMTLTQASSSVNYSPMLFAGTCTTGGCPNLRVDNIVFANWLGNGQATWMIRSANMFGVVDHNIVGSDASPSPIQGLVNINHPSYFGVGTNGDNSWTQPDSLGTANALYLENNTFHGGASATDCDISNGVPGNVGGCRQVGRFNTFTSAGSWLFLSHGTESGGRMRGGRVQEVYNNNATCNVSPGCGSIAAYRSGGTGVTFDNHLVASGANFNMYASLSAYRTMSGFYPYGSCNGEGPWDLNDNATQTSVSTFTATASTTLTDTSQTWAVNQFAPGTPGVGQYYTVHNATTGQYAGIVSNTSNTLTIKQPVSWSTGDTYYINGTKLYAKGTVTNVSGGTPGNFNVTITDTSQSWATNQWIPNGAPYSLIDISAAQGGGNRFIGDVGWEITGNTSNTVSSGKYNSFFNSITVNVGDIYIILRATVCLDQPGRSGGILLSGNTTPPSPVSYINETLDPIYEWGDTLSGAGSPNVGVVGSDTGRLITNRDWYNESVNQAAQSSPTSPFNGTTGTGHGILANRPITCTPRVGYWATDQGNWNQSGSGGQGELFICTATNTWTMTYQPYTYPHPLITGGASPPSPPPTRPAAPTGLAATVQP
jgi:hypothetical protein